jgi:hypothetical protein
VSPALLFEGAHANRTKDAAIINQIGVVSLRGISRCLHARGRIAKLAENENAKGENDAGS